MKSLFLLSKKVSTCFILILLFCNTAISAEFNEPFCVDIDTYPTATRVFEFAVSSVNAQQYLLVGSHKNLSDVTIGSLTGSASMQASELTMHINATYSDPSDTTHGLTTYQLSLGLPSYEGSYWSMSHSNNASSPAWVNDSGSAKLVSCDANLTVFSNECTGDSCNTVPRVLTGLNITGSNLMDESGVIILKAMAEWSDGSIDEVTDEAIWSENSGLLTDPLPGFSMPGSYASQDVATDTNVIVSANYSAGGVTVNDEHTVLVKDSGSTAVAVLTGLKITGDLEVLQGGDLRLTATASWSDGTTSDITSSASWSENSEWVNSVSKGLVKAGQVTSDQQVTITASYASGDVSKVETYDITVKVIEQSSTRFHNNGNGTLTDTTTNLFWEQLDKGQQYDWDSAMSYCSSYSPDGSRSWRLPTKNELVALLDSTESPMIDDAFTGTSGSHYWTSVTFDEDDPDGGAYAVNFGNGSVDYLRKLGNFNVRCVR